MSGNALGTPSTAAPLVPPHIVPPREALRGPAFITAFVRNPLSVIPQAAYEEDFISVAKKRAWITSPALIRAVLVDQRDKFQKLQQIRLLSPLLGRGILTSQGAQWRWQRQAAAPMFTPALLAGYVSAFVRAAEERVSAWRKGDGEVRRIDDEMTRATFDVIISTLLPSGDEALPQVVRKTLKDLRRTGGWDLLFAVMNLPSWLPRPGMFSEPRATRELRAAIMAIVQPMRAEGGVKSLTHSLIAARDPETGRAMDDEQLVDNVLTFYLAGHETTAKALTWVLYLLARSPEWTSALLDEIERVTGRGPIVAEHLDSLILTQQVIQESMRLYPPVPIMSRQAVTDAEIEGHRIRAGTSLIMPIYAIHRHARRWQDPHAFLPQRFAASTESSMPRYQYMPFGAGPRVCIGRVFAMMEATAMLATFLRHARFSVAEDYDPAPVARVTLVPAGGMPMRVTVGG